jgi:hypothetical protein
MPNNIRARCCSTTKLGSSSADAKPIHVYSQLGVVLGPMRRFRSLVNA